MAEHWQMQCKLNGMEDELVQFFFSLFSSYLEEISLHIHNWRQSMQCTLHTTYHTEHRNYKTLRTMNNYVRTNYQINLREKWIEKKKKNQHWMEFRKGETNEVFDIPNNLIEGSWLSDAENVHKKELKSKEKTTTK